MKRKEIEKKIKNIYKTISAVMFMCFFMGMQVFASEPKIISGTKKLISDTTLWATGLIAGVTILMAIVRGIKWQVADEDEKPRAAKAVKNTLIIGAIITCISGIVTLVFSYYA